MPKTTVVFFKEEDGRVPLLEWLESLPDIVQDKCLFRIERLFESNPDRYEYKEADA